MKLGFLVDFNFSCLCIRVFFHHLTFLVSMFYEKRLIFGQYEIIQMSGFSEFLAICHHSPQDRCIPNPHENPIYDVCRTVSFYAFFFFFSCQYFSFIPCVIRCSPHCLIYSLKYVSSDYRKSFFL